MVRCILHIFGRSCGPLTQFRGPKQSNHHPHLHPPLLESSDNVITGADSTWVAATLIYDQSKGKISSGASWVEARPIRTADYRLPATRFRGQSRCRSRAPQREHSTSVFHQKLCVYNPPHILVSSSLLPRLCKTRCIWISTLNLVNETEYHGTSVRFLFNHMHMFLLERCFSVIPSWVWESSPCHPSRHITMNAVPCQHPTLLQQHVGCCGEGSGRQ